MTAAERVLVGAPQASCATDIIESQPLATVQRGPLAGGFTLPPVNELRASLADYHERWNAFLEWLHGTLKEGVHYGHPPGCKPKEVAPGVYSSRGGNYTDKEWKPRKSLYKAGAEYLCGLVRLRPVFEFDRPIWEAMGSKPGVVVIKCRLLNDGSPFFPSKAIGEQVGEGYGAGNASDPNKAIKDAEKRALVGATLHALGLSGSFDPEEYSSAAEPNPAPATDASAPRVAPREQRKAEPDGERVTVEMLKDLYNRWLAANEGTGDIAAFRKFVAQLAHTDDPQRYAGTSGWSIDLYNMVSEAIR